MADEQTPPPADWKARSLELSKSGLKPQAISKILGRSRGTISGYLSTQRKHTAARTSGLTDAINTNSSGQALAPTQRGMTGGTSPSRTASSLIRDRAKAQRFIAAVGRYGFSLGRKYESPELRAEAERVNRQRFEAYEALLQRTKAAVDDSAAETERSAYASMSVEELAERTLVSAASMIGVSKMHEIFLKLNEKGQLDAVGVDEGKALIAEAKKALP